MTTPNDNLTATELAQLDVSIPAGQTVPYVEQYLGVWAMREQELAIHADLFRGLDIALHLKSQGPRMARESADAYTYEVNQSGIATLTLAGPLMKQSSSMSANTSTVEARRALRAAVADDFVKAIVLRIDSPGGTVAGTKELADDIAKAGMKKPVIAYVEDLGASAAYWIASQAREVVANATALVGSIGTYGVVHDMSGAAAASGVKVHVVRAGKFKGMGVPGTEVTADHLAEMSRNVNALNSFFLNAVAAGRKMSDEQVAVLADGRTHIASEAKRLGLIDEVEDYDAFLSRVTAQYAGSGSGAMRTNKPSGLAVRGTGPVGDSVASEQGDKLMSQEAQGPKPATIAEIKAACDGASSDFVLAQVEAGATLEAAIKAHAKVLSEQLAVARADAAKALEEASKAKASASVAAPAAAAKTGVKPIAQASDESSQTSAREEWTAKVEAKVNKGYPRDKACSQVNRENPGLRQRMVAEQNA